VTVEELLADARRARAVLGDMTIDTAAEERLYRLSLGVVDLLARDFPCGWDQPKGVRFGDRPFVSWDGEHHTPDDIRGVAIALLRAADDAERPR
jgi:hypothetical protein